MPKVIKIDSFGGPEVMQMRTEPRGSLKSGEALVAHIAAGVNYLDISHRQGHYPLPLPTGLGVSGCGIIKEIRTEGLDLAVGDIVAYAGVSPGSYAEERSVAADRLVKLPATIEPELAAAALQQGITAAFLLQDVFPVRRGHVVLVHAAAGGVGTILCQWARTIGSTVIGVVGSKEKASHALSHGCKYVVVSTSEKVADQIRELTGGRGADVVFDSTGADSFETSLRSLSMRGMLVSFGSASGDPPSIEVGKLAQLGSLYLTRPRFIHYTHQRQDLLRYAAAFFAKVESGLKVPIGQIYKLDQLAQAHRDVENRATRGSSVIVF
ncbi:quinone oxidoreductase [Bradyrhizobium sp. 62B]|uniref:quinone oxidoreductase family protein n=1 Tax=Bradyrhizobium sp. 62B TaxID=2898442 RepID=UPI002557E2E6|nr:quinone oxidoreductase [Bradyrhizobium sp. 62B]